MMQLHTATIMNDSDLNVEGRIRE